MKDRESSPDLEQEDINPTPLPHHQPRIRQTSQVIPEFKMGKSNPTVIQNTLSFIHSPLNFFKNHSALEVGGYAGLVTAVSTGTLWSLVYALPPAAIGGSALFFMGFFGKLAAEQVEKCKNNSASKKLAP